MTRDVSNSADIIYSRDIVERIDELQAERQELADTVDEAKEAIDEYEGDTKSDEFDALHDAHDEAVKALNEWADSDEGQELKALLSLQEQAEGYSEDWRHGATLIRDSYFKDYAQELAEDIGAIDGNQSWPLTCIDWDQAARELQQDYTSVDFDGVDYWVR